MSTKATVLKLLHLGEILEVKKKKKKGGLLPIFCCGSQQEILGHYRAYAKPMLRHGPQARRMTRPRRAQRACARG